MLIKHIFLIYTTKGRVNEENKNIKNFLKINKTYPRRRRRRGIRF